MEEVQKEIDNIIDQALIDFKDELSSLDFSGWENASIYNRIEKLCDHYKSLSVLYINTNFPTTPDGKLTVLQSQQNNTARFLLYPYASKRDGEFIEIWNRYADSLEKE